MAENKKSFVLYSDMIYTVEKLSDEDAGKLLKHLLLYVNDRDPEPVNLIVDLVLIWHPVTCYRDAVLF